MYATKTLQGVGTVWAKPAAQLVAGDVTVWNYGGTYRVIGVEAISPKFVRVAMVATHDIGGERIKVWYRRTKADFLIGCAT